MNGGRVTKGQGPAQAGGPKPPPESLAEVKEQRAFASYLAATAVTRQVAALGAEAARIAGTRLHDEALARSLWQILAKRAPDPDLRRRAAAEARGPEGS